VLDGRLEGLRVELVVLREDGRGVVVEIADAADLRRQVDADLEAGEELGGDPALGQVGLVEVDAGGVRGGPPCLRRR